METDLKKLEEQLGYHFQDRKLLLTALTHTSYANEHRKEGISHNERLEFLGDAVLETVSSEYLYQSYPELDEGKLSKLRASMVCESSLARCAARFGLSDYIRLGRGEEQLGGRLRPSITSDAMEALIGAVYLDGGGENARTIVMKLILLDLKPSELFRDYKSRLQEVLQEDGGIRPEYELLLEEGPDHAKHFVIGVTRKGTLLGKGEGQSKKAAAQAAARDALKNMGKI